MKVFAYGTLREPIIRDRLLGHPVDARAAVLRGYVKVCGWDYLTLVPDPEGVVAGVVFEATDADIERMDLWEEVPVYRLDEVEVECDGSPVRAGCYIMPEPPRHYEVVDDSCIAAIPIPEIIAEMESIMGRRRCST